MAKELALISRVERTDAKTDQSTLHSVRDRLAEAGYPMSSEVDFPEMARVRTDYTSCVDALAEHLGKPSAPLLPKS